MLRDFKSFVTRGNVMDLAIGIILGAAFLAVVQSLVKDVVMPPIGLVLGKVDFSNLFAVVRSGVPTGPYANLAQAQNAGAVTVNYGLFVNAVVSFLIVSFVVFLIIRSLNRARIATGPAPEAVTRPCPYCLSAIPTGATRCAFCTSEVKAAT